MDTKLFSATALSPQLLATAPHRLMFFIGASNVLLAMLWWTAWLVDARWPVIRDAAAARPMPAGCTRS